MTPDDNIGQLVAAYDYTDESGKLLYQNVRYDPKDFRQRRPDPTNPGGYIWNLDGTRRVLYQLRGLLQANPSEWVYYVEGEKDTENLRCLGLVATTAGAVHSWRDEFAEFLNDRRVCVLPDKDEPGQKLALRVAEALRKVGCPEVKILNLPGLGEKQDVSDWLNNGGTKAELIRLTGQAKSFVPVTVNFPLTDAGNAERFAAMHKEQLRFCVEHNRWYWWDGCRWNGGLGGEKAEQLAIVTARSIVDDAKNVLDSKEREKILLWSISCENAYRLRAMLSLAQTQNPIVCHANDFDKDSYLFNCHNGTLDLHTGTLSEHKAGDMLTKLCPVEYDENAQLDLLDNFLNDTTGGNAPLKDFLQIAVGYSLTGETTEEKLFFVHGPTAAGKSTFTEGIKATLGDYAVTADFETFLKRVQVGAIRNDVARLAGARFVVSIEVDEGRELAEGLTKILTGGDTVSTRFLYHESFEFFPKFKLWLAANHAPRVSDRDDALWRRILRIPFEHTISEEKRDPKVKATLRDPKIAGPAILAWAVRGCLLWQQFGLCVPEIIRNATEAYRSEQDPLKDFFEDECLFDPSGFVAVTALRQRYDAWAKELGLKYTLGPREFNKRLKDKNCEQKTQEIQNDVGTLRPTRCWFGVTLQTNPKNIGETVVCQEKIPF